MKRFRRTHLPAEFVSYVLGLLENSSSHQAAWRFLILRWTLWGDGIAGNEIPGYRTPPPAHGKTGIPYGWTSMNLRRLAPDPCSPVVKKPLP